MNITKVQIYKAKKRGVVLAYANIILDDTFIIRGITLLEGKKGRFLGMPSRKLKGDKPHYRDTCHPLNADVRNELTEIVFTAYDEFIKTQE